MTGQEASLPCSMNWSGILSTCLTSYTAAIRYKRLVKKLLRFGWQSDALSNSSENT